MGIQSDKLFNSAQTKKLLNWEVVSSFGSFPASSLLALISLVRPVPLSPHTYSGNRSISACTIVSAAQITNRTRLPVLWKNVVNFWIKERIERMFHFQNCEIGLI
ncbi:hypothetical protein ACLKA6_002883 [Drosophila palustris]